MKYLLMTLSLVWLLPALLRAEPAVSWLQGDECNLYIENAVDQTANQVLYMSLRTDIFFDDDPENTGWYYYIVHTARTKNKLLKAFLPHLRQYHRHSKLPFSAVKEYWKKLYDVPIQIYVFNDQGEQLDAFSTSYACEQIITTARTLGLGFLWNGAAEIAEEQIKDILNVPSDQSLITTIFLYPAKTSKITQAMR